MATASPSLIKRIRFRLFQPDHSVMVWLAAVVGILGGLCAVAFRKFIVFVQTTAWQMPEFTLAGLRAQPSWYLILVPTVGGLVIGLIIHFFAREAKGHGVPEVMEAVMARGGRIRARVVAAKMVASGICIGTGGSVGREGPIVQIGSALGSSIGQVLKLGERRLKTLVACGAAAGVAATFNAPIAGVLFAAEVILGDFAPALLTPIVISSVAATVVSHHFFGDFPAFVVPTYSLVSAWELIVYAGLGLASGLTALLFSKVLYASEDFFDGPLKRIPGPVQATIGGFLIGVIALKFPEIMGVGYEAIEMALHEEMVWHTLLILAVVKIAAVSITIGSGGSGGVFAPSLMIGAMVGGALGWAAHSVWPDATASSGAYALVGAGAVVAAATHAPLTAFMIIFELTNDYKIIMPLMIACVIATLLATRLSEASIYTRKLLRRGLDVFRGRTLNVLHGSRVRDNMRETGNIVAPNVHLTDLAAHFLGDPHESIYVVDGEGRYLGIITFDDMKPFLASPEGLDRVVIALDVMRMGDFPTVDPETRLDLVMRQFGSCKHDIPVVGDGRLLGVVHRQDVIDRYNAEVFKAEMASSMAGSLDGSASSPIPGVANMALAEIPVPASFTGRTCGDLDLRNRFGVTLIMVRQQTEGGHEIVNQIPDAAFEFEDGDVLLAVGTPDRLKALQNLL